MLKVMTLVGTRPELIKMSAVIREMDKVSTHVLVHSGQNFDPELNDVFFSDLGIRPPDHYLAANGSNAIETISNVLLKFDRLLEAERPDALLIYGDTNTGLGIIPAKRRRVPIFHMEAGNRCFDQRVPEELNRKVIDHLADVNIVLTEHARRYLIAEGIPAHMIFKCGSHLPEVIEFAADAIARSDILTTLELNPQEYLLVSLHREENVDIPSRLKALVGTLSQLAREFSMPVVVSTHPRTRMRLEEAGIAPSTGVAGVRFLKPFGFVDYAALQTNAYCVLSDSGTITEESALMGFPAINVREAHERPEGVDAGTLIMSGLDAEGIVEAVKVTKRHQLERGRGEGRVSDYDSPHVSRSVAKIVLGYTSYVNRTVWHKQ